MSTSPESNHETEITLYNPSSEEAEELDPAALDQNVIDIEIDRELAERLLDVSKHLGLNPTIVASRAIDLVCEEMGTLDEDWRDDEDKFGTVTLIQRYQARVDLLHALKSETEDADDTGSSVEDQQAPDETDTEPNRREPDEEDKKLWEAVGQIKNVLDDVESATEETGTETEDDSSPAEELTDDGSAPQSAPSDAPEAGHGAGDEQAPEESSRWETVRRIVSVFSGRDDYSTGQRQRAREQVDAESKQEPPPTEDSGVDAAAIREGTLEQMDSSQEVESEDEDERPQNWDAVESIIKEGERAKR